MIGGLQMSLEHLGYYSPGHSETICHVEGRDDALARTALQHEEAHENLNSWSTIGQYSTYLTNIDALVPRVGIPPDPLICLQMLVDASRQTHEGFATFSQLMYILARFGINAFNESFDRLPKFYRRCAGKFAVLFRLIAGNDAFFVQPPSIVAVRSFAIVALNVDIFQRVGAFNPDYSRTQRTKTKRALASACILRVSSQTEYSARRCPRRDRV
jgi:hypothetical protein